MSLLTRRRALTIGLGAGGALVIGTWLRHDFPGAGTDTLFAPNAFIRVPVEGPVRLVISRTEMGQGTITGTAMLIAEELEVDPASVEFEFAPADRAYDNPMLQFQNTGGSTSTSTSWEPMRLAGATARELLKEAAARRWKVSRSELTAKLGVVHHAPSNRSARYGELVADAAKVRVHEPELKPKQDFTVIGRPVPRLDAVTKSNGSAVFGLDVKVPGALVAVIVRSPVPGGSVKSFDDAQTRTKSGVRHVVKVSAGVAVVADTYWQARQGANALTVDWNEGAFASFDSSTLVATHRAVAAGPTGKRVRDDGQADQVLSAAGEGVLTAEYTAPFLAHATMEPQNATAHCTANRCEVWAPTQGPGIARAEVARLTGLPPEAIEIHQTYLGGGFGRRITQDYVVEAVEVSRAIQGPVKVVWSREDDLRSAFYRPAATHLLRAVVEGSGVKAWRHQVVTQSILAAMLDPFVIAAAAELPDTVKRRLVSFATGVAQPRDLTSYEGAETLPYEIPNVAVDSYLHEPGVPTGFWRAVGQSHTAFATESFIDECAHAAKQDPATFRKALLVKKPRHLAVLDLVLEKAGWNTPLPQGRARGLAVHESINTVAAAVLEVSGSGDAGLQVHRAVMAIDCGTVVNPDLVKAQVESSVIFGLSAAMKQQVTFKAGRVEQSNFHDYPALRMNEAPAIETHVVPSDAPPCGIGEPALPVVAPALANAVFALTGQRLRSLPLELPKPG